MATAGNRITKDAAICGGDACIRGHRIPVWVLVNCRRLGASVAEVLNAYPVLTLADLEDAWDYAAENAAEIDHAISENEVGSDRAAE